MAVSRDAAHFETLYRANPDPWQFTTSAYEQAKYTETLAALDHRHFSAGLEIGCSIGVLTERLAPCCDTLLGIDLAATALAAAAARCAHFPHVRFAACIVPERFPQGRFDLIMISEILYFLIPADIATLASQVGNALAPGGTILLVNYTGLTDDPCTGDEAADYFIADLPGIPRTLHRRAERYRIDRLDRAG